MHADRWWHLGLTATTHPPSLPCRHVVTDTTGDIHPCLAPLREAHNVTVINRGLIEDFSYIMNAEHVASTSYR